MSDDRAPRKRRGSWTYWLLIIPVIFLMWVPSYNRVEPTLAGFPFFYWYQMLWIVITAVLTAFSYFMTERE